MALPGVPTPLASERPADGLPRAGGVDHAAEVRTQLVAECGAMASYSFACGLPVPAGVVVAIAESSANGAADGQTNVSGADLERMARAHRVLSQVVAPATPRTLRLLEDEQRRGGRWRFLGPVPLVRQMMAASFVFLLVFAVTALSPQVNRSSGDIFQSSGSRLLVNEVFLLCAAGMGASFAALFRANRYVAEGTYDPKFETSYWVRFVLGLTAGMVLAALIPVEKGATYSRPLLALLGGFSASVVYVILDRLVGTLESLVRGNGDASSAPATALRVEQHATQERARLAGALLQLRERAAAGLSSDLIQSELARILEETVVSDFGTAPISSPVDAVEPASANGIAGRGERT